MVGCTRGNLGARDQFKRCELTPCSAPAAFPWAWRGPTIAQLRPEGGGVPPIRRPYCGGGLLLRLGDPRDRADPSPRLADTQAPFPVPLRPARRRQERASVGPRRCPRARASARERAPGRARARWRPRRGRRLGPGSRRSERRAAAPRPWQSRTHCSGPGPGWSPRTPFPRPQSPRASGLGARQPPPTPHPWPYPGPAAPPRPGDSPCPLPAPRGSGCLPAPAPRPLGLENLSPCSPGPPNVGSPEPCLLRDPPNPPAPCSDPAAPAPDVPLASSWFLLFSLPVPAPISPSQSPGTNPLHPFLTPS